MRIALTIGLMLSAGPALAHIGHLGEVAGHGHWIGLGAIALAGAIGALAAKGRKAEAKDAPEADAPGDEEAPA